MGKIKDLRSFLDVLKSEGRFALVEKEVDLVHELANVAATLARMQGKGALFNHPKFVEGGYQWQIFANAVISPDTAAVALACCGTVLGPGGVLDNAPGTPCTPLPTIFSS